MSQPSSTGEIVAVKVPVMIFMFLEILFFGSLPLRMKAFKQNKLVLSFSSAFSGGLFLAIGIVHLLPEAHESFESYFEEGEVHDHHSNHGGDGDEEEHFPWAFLITTLSFSLILFIEKVLTVGWGHDHHHHHHHGEDESDVQHTKQNLKLNTDQSEIISNNEIQKKFLGHQEQNSNHSHSNHQPTSKQDQCDEENAEQEEEIKIAISSTSKVIQKISMAQETHNEDDSKINKLTPYILQVAIGIHAIFEGMAIGLQQEWLPCLAISLAVVFHKWAEGLTLGIAYRKAQIDLKISTINICIQATMNPIGIGIGWLLSNQGNLVEGIFMSISVGTFIYIASMEVLVEEFNLPRYRYTKYLLFLLAIGFVCSLWFMEQLSESAGDN